MPNAETAKTLRDAIRASTLSDEARLVPELVALAGFGDGRSSTDGSVFISAAGFGAAGGTSFASTICSCRKPRSTFACPTDDSATTGGGSASNARFVEIGGSTRTGSNFSRIGLAEAASSKKAGMISSDVTLGRPLNSLVSSGSLS